MFKNIKKSEKLNVKRLLDSISSFPFVVNLDFCDGRDLQQHRDCQDCKNKDCLSFLRKSTPLDFYRCSKGYDCISISNRENGIMINGLILSSNMALSKITKRAKGRYIISAKQLRREGEKYQEAIEVLEETRTVISEKEFDNTGTSEQLKTSFALLHDVKTSFGIAFSISEKLIYDQEGDNFTEKYKNSPKEFCDLFDALEITNSQFNMLNILYNPESITYGKKHMTNLFKLFHKLSSLFKNRLTQGKSIEWYDNNKDIPDIACYESIMLVPMVLIDNAIKYSLPGKRIKIDFDIIEDKIKVEVDSYGPVVCDDEIECVQKKFFRGQNALKNKLSGMGVGLWLANEILKAHDSKIQYSKTTSNGEHGSNRFFFFMKLSENVF